MSQDPIRRLSPTTRSRQGPTPQLGPESFGAGIGQALRNMGSSIAGLQRSEDMLQEAQAQVTRAYDRRQLNLSRAQAQADFIRMESEFRREQVQRSTEAPPDGEGFTNNEFALARKRSQEFLSSLQVELQEEFLSDTEQFIQNSTDVAFDFENTAERTDFQRTTRDLTSEVINQILSTEVPLEELDAIEDNWRSVLEERLSLSPLTQAETEVLGEELTGFVTRAKLARETQEEALLNLATGQGTPDALITTANGRVVKSRDGRPVASGLPAAAVGLLTAIARPESAGAYNIMYSPEGSRYFEDFSSHPNQPAVINYGKHKGELSSAAGKYQFIKGTWDRVAAGAGLSDFSPESQDLGAWWLAQDDYRKRTGRDLLTVLQSGNYSLIAQARTILAPTWEGLKNVSNEEFFKSVVDATGTTSSLIFDEEFASIPFGERQEIAAAGQAQAQAIRNQQAQASIAASNQAFNDLARMIESRDTTATPTTIRLAARQQGWSFQQEQQLVNQWEEQNAESLLAAQTIVGLDDPNTLWTPNAAGTQSGLNALYKETSAVTQLNDMNEAYVDSVLLPSVQRTMTLTPGMASSLLQQAQSTNIQQSAFALRTLAKMQEVAPGAVTTALSSEQENMITAFRSLDGFVAEDQLMKQIGLYADPQFEAVRAVAGKRFDQEVSDGNLDFSIRGVANTLFSGIFVSEPHVDDLQGGQLSAEYQQLLRTQYTLTGNIEQAKNNAKEIIERRWGVVEVNGRRQVMKYPPTQVLPPFNGSHDYVFEQFSQDTGGDEGYFFFSTEQTGRELARGIAPSYAITRIDENGTIMPVFMRDLPGFSGTEEEGRRPARFVAEVTQTMIDKQVEKGATINGLRQQIDELENAIGDATAEKDWPLARRLAEDLRAARQQLKELN